MRTLIRKFFLTAACVFSALGVHNAQAWDAVGHRVSAVIASRYISPELRPELLRILQQHPRYEQDFVAQMPAYVTRGNDTQRFEWLLGQAAFWPDTARGLPEAQRAIYNRANWHYIDGAWLRGQARTQGNTYIGISPFDDINGEIARAESAADNVMTALDYNAALLADEQAPIAQRAVALCWVLHLMGDIHQPLHAGSLYSARLFEDGDRGGNGIATDDGNLHARWDQALRGEGIRASVDAILTQHGATLDAMEDSDDGDWSLWLHESRALLLNTVYNETMKSAISRADAGRGSLPEFALDNAYVETMKYHAAMRLGLAGRRIALWFDENL